MLAKRAALDALCDLCLLVIFCSGQCARLCSCTCPLSQLNSCSQCSPSRGTWDNHLYSRPVQYGTSAASIGHAPKLCQLKFSASPFCAVVAERFGSKQSLFERVEYGNIGGLFKAQRSSSCCVSSRGVIEQPGMYFCGSSSTIARKVIRICRQFSTRNCMSIDSTQTHLLKHVTACGVSCIVYAAKS